MSYNGAASIATLLTLADIHNAANEQPRTDPGTTVLALSSQARSKGYDFVCIPLTTDNWKKRWTEMCLLPAGTDPEANVAAERLAEAWRARPAFLRDEVTITKLEEAEGVSVLVSEWLELDAADDWVRHDAEIALQQELAYASYLNIQSAILPPPRNREHVSSYARTVNACLKSSPYMHFSIRLPIYNPSVLDTQRSPLASPGSSHSPQLPSTPRLVVSADKGSEASSSDLDGTWEMWDVIRSICDYSTRLSLSLDLTPPLPIDSGFLSKWRAEPIKYLFLPASSFIANTKGYPVLPKATQSFIRESMSHRPVILLSGANSGMHSRGGELAYSQYLRHLEKTSPVVQAANTSGTVEHFAQGYQDYLQAPLQPLMDNLQSVTYHTFEQDPVKYHNYEEAIFHALMDWPGEGKIILCVAGAGRGPIVARALRAIERSRRDAHVYAVEKNPNAYVTLQARKETEWGTEVTLLFGDMRFIDIPEKADILISELLGSFGDNELSPECLDGAMRFLKPDGISIPSSYTAHLAPLSSSKLYNEARAGKDEKSMETPYVVMFQAVNILSGDGSGTNGRCGPQIQECWEFEHPRRDAVVDERGLPLTNSHNARSATLDFYIPHAGVLHGLAGYFEAVLYGNIGLSIHPHRKDRISKDMLSWFPLFFPLKEPLYLPSNSELRVSIWRLTNERQVWYEWHAEAFMNVMSAVLPASDDMLASPRSPSFTANGHIGSPLFAAASPRNTPSPLLDASDLPFDRKTSISRVREPESAIVKIGHTSLHNPGGKSSWIGL
ncbi:PRMT5 arginine-N-methyltransferase-domain-containing protein [Roridomyces roridus]|uniref:PRMT5 arginine-N-methyltransferase-domain-containing protein n=1 Tax=Roridomyces roridus TaxID=1738132 RepID=A0AAD7CJ63_9AGAR|nr:PRMT5 arginine-N-methyltransferase-domain-containing protein [Roridomyces roridus]